jgi:hypothetical protein
MRRLRYRFWRRARLAELRRRPKPMSRGEFVELLMLEAATGRVSFFAPSRDGCADRPEWGPLG